MPNEEKQMSDLIRHDISMTDSPVEDDSPHSEGFIANLFDGRRNRWQYFLYNTLINVFLGLVYYIIIINFWIGGFLFGVCSIFNISNTVKRLHDMNVSTGWCIPILILLFIGIPVDPRTNPALISCFIIQIVTSIVLLFYPGTKGCNRYRKA